MGRNLAAIQKIVELIPIEGADRIENAKILGWNCVVRKGEHKVGGLVVYLEVDSLVPDTEPFQFLKPEGALNDKWRRIRTRRFKKQISQGLVMPLLILENLMSIPPIEEGVNVTEQLGIELYQPPIPADLRGLVKGSFPSFMPRTDETRVQVLQDVLTRWKGAKCYVTEKIDGTSVTFFLKDGVFGVCSRNLELIETPGNAYWEAARKLDVEQRLKDVGRNIAIQGELYGHGIQENPLNVEGRQVRFFNVFDIDKYAYMDYECFVNFMDEIGLETVPMVDVSGIGLNEFVLIDDIPTLVQLATRKSVINPKKWAEGIVIRPIEEKMDMQMATGFGNGRVSFKAVNPEYLLEHGG